MDQDRASETVGILTPIVGMIPVSAWLIDLFPTSASESSKLLFG